ncbi:DUF4262 domain-containing protein [Branchiibius cervicis]|uniref:DUF4262 domain-containing protein n=1 Tax=Branchiibius cervicis TaxID=908252 RepID=A0ABW2AR29_9MICO
MARMTRESWRRRRDSDLRAKIRTFGFHGAAYRWGCDDPTCTEPHSPVPEQFAYTIGLTERGHPELLVVGLVCGDSVAVLNHLGHGVAAHGDRLAAGEFIDLGAFGTGALIDVVDSSQQLRVANEFYRLPYLPPVRALQLVVAGSDRFN